MQVLSPEGWAAPIGYSNGIASDAGRLVFLFGQVGWDAEMRFASELIAPQFECSMSSPCYESLAARRRAHLPHNSLLLREASQSGSAAGTWSDLATPHGQPLSGDEHDTYFRPAGRPGKNRAPGDDSCAAPQLKLFSLAQRLPAAAALA